MFLQFSHLKLHAWITIIRVRSLNHSMEPTKNQCKVLYGLNKNEEDDDDGRQNCLKRKLRERQIFLFCFFLNIGPIKLFNARCARVISCQLHDKVNFQSNSIRNCLCLRTCKYVLGNYNRKLYNICRLTDSYISPKSLNERLNEYMIVKINIFI